MVWYNWYVSIGKESKGKRRSMRMFCCQATANMVIGMAVFNPSQYTRMVFLTPDYTYMTVEPVFISIHWLVPWVTIEHMPCGHG